MRLRWFFHIGVLLFHLCGLKAEPPVVNLQPSGPLNAEANQPLSITATASDPENNALSFDWSIIQHPGGTIPQISTARLDQFRSRATFAPTTRGAYLLQVEVDDQDADPSTKTTASVIINSFLTRNLYVSTQGSDTASGTAPETPLRTLERAFTLVEPGDTIVLQSLDSSTPQSPTTFFLDNLDWGDGGDEAAGTQNRPIILQPQKPGEIEFRPLGNALYGLRLLNTAFLQLRNLKFRGFTQRFALEIVSSSNIAINSTTYTLSNTAIFLDRVTNSEITQSRFIKNTSGIQMGATTSVEVVLSEFIDQHRHGIFIEPAASVAHKTEKNRIAASTFYGNGSIFLFDPQVGGIRQQQGALSYAFDQDLEDAEKNIFEDLLFVNNIKDFWAQKINNHTLNRLISFANVMREKDEQFVVIPDDDEWRVVDPLFVNPAEYDFRLRLNSPAIGTGNGGSNIGSYQGLGVNGVTSGPLIIVDQNSGSLSSDCGNQDNPCSSLQTALQKASAGSILDLKQGAFVADFQQLLGKTGPGWGRITLNAQSGVSLSCSPASEAAMNLNNLSFLTINNLRIGDRKLNNTVANTCTGVGIQAQNARHLTFNGVQVMGLSTGVRLQSADRVLIQTSILGASQTGISATSASLLNDGESVPSHRLELNKVTLAGLNKGLELHKTSAVTVQNSLVFPSADCIHQTPDTQSTNLTIVHSLCLEGSNASNTLFQGSSNIYSLNPQLRTTVTTTLSAFPASSVQLMDRGTGALSPALNAGNPSYAPGIPVLQEFGNLPSTPPITASPSEAGVIDIGALEQRLTDTDGDGIPNEIEKLSFYQSVMNPNEKTDVHADSDSDGLTNGIEILETGSCIVQSPLSPNTIDCLTPQDSDKDGFEDATEYAIGSNPIVDDSEIINQALPKPQIISQHSVSPPARFVFEGVDQKGRTPTNLWVLCSIPGQTFNPCLTPAKIQEQSELEPELRKLTFNASSSDLVTIFRRSGVYTVGLDQILGFTETDLSNVPSLPQDRATTTITVLDTPPAAQLPPSRMVQGLTDAPHFLLGGVNIPPSHVELNGDSIVLQEWLTQNNNPDCRLSDSTQPNPLLPLKQKSYVCQYKLRLTDSTGQQSISSQVFTLTVSADDKLPYVAPSSPGSITLGRATELNALPSSSVTTVYWEILNGEARLLDTESNVQSTACDPFSSTPSNRCATGSKIRIEGLQTGHIRLQVTGYTANLESSEPKLVDTVIDSDTNQTPIAIIEGPVQSRTGNFVSYDATQSFDPASASNQQGTAPRTYYWKQIEGPTVNAEQQGSTFRYYPIVEGTYSFTLAVDDTTGATSIPETISTRVIARDAASLNAQIKGAARASADRLTQLSGLESSPQNCSTLVSIDTGSSSEELYEFTCSPVLQYFWRQISGPSPISLATEPDSELTYSPGLGGVYLFELSVADSSGQFSNPDVFAVSVQSDSQNQPIANAGDSKTASIGSRVILRGYTSTDSDRHDSLSYAWRQIQGPSVNLSGKTSSEASFVAPQSGAYLFELTVYDGKVYSFPSVVRVDILPPEDDQPNRDPLPYSGAGDNVLSDAVLDAEPKNCFIVTASSGVRGTQVAIYTFIRDSILYSLPGGDRIMRTYYHYSPALARTLAKNPWFQFPVHLGLWALLILPLALPLGLLRKKE